MGSLSYTLALEPAEEGGFNVWVPAIPGCVTQANTHAEAIEMAKDAIELWVAALAQDGQQVPEEVDTYVVELAAVTIAAPMSS